MNCTACGPQTYVSAPGVGTAAAKHHRDMMWLRWPAAPGRATSDAPRPPRQRLPGGFTCRPKREPARNRALSDLPAASIATSSRYGRLPPLVHVSVFFRATRGPELANS
jgi:hypothetical protein